ncbi:MAG: LytTR family DNA-binding domain-containing protein [Cyclobacteriaceae bacterium]
MNQHVHQAITHSFNIANLNPSIGSDKLRLTLWLRVLVIPLLALTIVHLMSYGKLPFEEGYQFPLMSFVAILIYGLSICEVNRQLYNRISAHFSFKIGLFPLLLRHIIGTLLGTTATFLALSLLVLAITGQTQTFSSYLSYLLILTGISTIGTVLYYFIDIGSLIPDKPDRLKERSHLLKSGTSEMLVMEDDIAFVEWSGCLGRLITFNGERIITNYSSLNVIERKLDSDAFFRINRNLLVHHKAIRSFKKIQKSKLEVVIDLCETNKFVSRHTKKKFKSWLENQTGKST